MQLIVFFMLQIINQELFKLSKRLNAETENEKNMYQKMLGTKTPVKTKNSKSDSSNVRYSHACYVLEPDV